MLTALGAGCWSDRAPSAPTTPPPSITTLAPAPAPRWPGTGIHVRRGTSDRCAQVVGHIFDVAREDSVNTGFTAAMLDEFEVSAVESCHETVWAEESLVCYAETTAISQIGECFRLMGEAQREDFDRRFREIRTKHRPAPLPPPPPPPPPSSPQNAP